MLVNNILPIRKPPKNLLYENREDTLDDTVMGTDEFSMDFQLIRSRFFSSILRATALGVGC